MSVPKRRTTEAATLRSSAQLWGPLLIGVVAILFTFPAGMALAIINWQRMGMVRKARRHLLATVIGAYLFVLLIVLLPAFLPGSGITQIVFFAINVIAFFYLRREIDQDTDAYAYGGNEVHPANPLFGLAIGVVVLLTIIVIFIGTFFLLEALGVLQAPA
ncbi:MAG: hypothetical protein AVDCRST_MAG18-5199 [uncultured Thermomicrobiales bacterium]|uniref:DUF996 domain-containing protein n=1 Tax=uncultured Thermomicrobiales bacterium TaxID=1645740 RepID=A0A6J4VYU1_9BACT|nr:MAG: hypothetical protein AVDCRST_MAG18-5199 [uncultured Thermomicrobiales bacterium]